ncbi:MAG: hypothetical protein HYX60_03765, partial [Legionella longbeachae]|nr:hypothetical protein [Legionella longbeachae]
MFQKNIRKQFKNSVFSKTGYKPMMFQQPAHHNNLIIQKKNESLLWDSRYQSPIISAEEKLFEGPTKLAFQFTHLNPEFITRDISEIQELYQGIGTSNWQDPHYRCLQNLVVFKPDRKAMHLLQAYLTLNFSFHTSEEFLMALRHIEPLIVQQVQLKQDSFHLIHKNALSYATNDNDKLKQITQLIHKKLQKSNTAFSSHKIDLIGRKILFDDFYKETLRTELFTIIKKEVSQIFKHKIHS